MYRALETLETEQKITVRDIPARSPPGQEFILLYEKGYRGKSLGKGEASALVLAKYYGGTVVSNNLSDVALFCEENFIPLISTDDILCLACNKGYITQEEGNLI